DRARTTSVWHGPGYVRFHREFAVPAYIEAVQLGDVNQDNKRDLIMPNAAFFPATLGIRLDILKGNGDGTFATQTVPDCFWDVSDGQECRSVAVGDFDGDGTKDLMIVNFGVLEFLDRKSTRLNSSH